MLEAKETVTEQAGCSEEMREVGVVDAPLLSPAFLPTRHSDPFSKQKLPGETHDFE